MRSKEKAGEKNTQREAEKNTPNIETFRSDHGSLGQKPSLFFLSEVFPYNSIPSMSKIIINWNSHLLLQRHTRKMESPRPCFAIL